MSRIHPAWRVAACAFAVLIVAAGVRSMPSVLMVPFEREFGWSRAAISGAVAINIVLYGLTGPFAAALFERFGLRRTTAVALLAIAGGVALTPLMRQEWQLTLIWGVIVGGGSGVTALVLGTTVAARWFEQRRGLVVGVLSAATATGQLLFLPVLAALTESRGWRSASLLVAAAAASTVVVVLLFLRDRPAQLGIPPLGGARVIPHVKPEINPARRAVLALRAGLGRRDFWLLAGSFFICGASTNGLIGTHLIPACIDHGIPEVRAASLLAAMGVLDLVGTTCSGWLSDRFDSRVLLAWYYGLRGLSLLFLPFALDVGVMGWGGLAVFAAFYGLDWIATVPPTVRLAARCFGESEAPVMFGWIAASHQLGAGAAAWFAGATRVGTGSYLTAFMLAGGLCLVASLMMAFIGAEPREARATA